MKKDLDGMGKKRRTERKRPYAPPVVAKHTVKNTVRILSGAAVGSSSASFAVV